MAVVPNSVNNKAMNHNMCYRDDIYTLETKFKVDTLSK